ncbi:zincin, partial [Lentinus tigrinus ALCF2SS1-7]|uniref:zincin n=1 Tax=Lentinus tigrinus ALCF2SS1-7 TaxID=1328758 RepID=UPI001165D1CC
QTQGKTFPFMLSQAQPIYARSMAPLQDSSPVKITYNARVACVLLVLLSAIRVSPPSDGPAHDGKEIGKDVVTYEYKQLMVPRFLNTAEKILPPYRFGVYDLVLPPSFPYGGMENACLKSLTPTLFTGDAHLYVGYPFSVDVVFGNGVTQANSTHFWLNEGWTTYIERLLLQLLHTPADGGSSFLIGYKSLQDTLKQYEENPKYQRLVIDFETG